MGVPGGTFAQREDCVSRRVDGRARGSARLLVLAASAEGEDMRLAAPLDAKGDAY